MEIINPTNGKKIKDVSSTNVEDLGAMIDASHSSQKTWSNLSFEKRASYVLSFSEALKERHQSLAQTQTMETGKPIKQSKGEIKATIQRIEFFLNHTEKLIHDETVRQFNQIEENISYDPLGVVANISAWNYPYFVGTNVFIPALLTGNSIIYKPSEYATLVGQDIAQIWKDIGLPDHVFQLAIGKGDIGSKLLEQDINGVFFTGSYNTGRAIATKVAPRMIKLGLELGGKDPAYVAEDSDPKQAAIALADGAFYNAGQSCCSVERIYVHEKSYSEFVDAFLEQVRSFKIGDPTDEETYIGPLTRREGRKTLASQIEDALSKGAQLAVGGKPIGEEGNYFEPTVLLQVNHAMQVMREESFGPIIGIQKVANDHEAIDLMSDTNFGLTASVYSQDKPRGQSILKEMNSGTVYWNMCDRISPYLPWSGRNRSGIGSTLGTIGIRSFVQPKSWHMNHGEQP